MKRSILIVVGLALIAGTLAGPAAAKGRDSLNVYTAKVSAERAAKLAARYDVTAQRRARGGIRLDFVLTRAQRGQLAREGVRTKLRRVKAGSR